MPKDAIDIINDPSAVKVLATVDAAGVLNVVPKGTISAIDEETVIFGDIWGDKTNTNLNSTGKAAIVAFKAAPPFPGFQVKGTFQGFQSSGDLFNTVAKQTKEAVKLDIRAVGVIKVDEVYSAGPPNPGARLA
jgi:predicted pyridoxine 5'-phosphate oxidase superfamily flavin-nucleotide-binding protein